MNKFLSQAGFSYFVQELKKLFQKYVLKADYDKAVAGLTIDESNSIKTYVDGVKSAIDTKVGDFTEANVPALVDAKVSAAVGTLAGTSAGRTIADLVGEVPAGSTLGALVSEAKAAAESAKAGDSKILAFVRIGKNASNTKQTVADALGVAVDKVADEIDVNKSYIAVAYGADVANATVKLTEDVEGADAPTSLSKGEINAILTSLDDVLYPAATYAADASF